MARWFDGAGSGVGQQECFGSCAVRRRRRWDGSIRVILAIPGGPNVLKNEWSGPRRAEGTTQRGAVGVSNGMVAAGVWGKVREQGKE